LYVIAEAASISRLRNATMSKFCLTSVTSFLGRGCLDERRLLLELVTEDQTPYFLPFIFWIELIPLSFHVTSVVPLRV